MAKTLKMISIDNDVNQILKMRGVNVSGVCNDYLKRYVEIEEKDVKIKDEEVKKEKALKLEVELGTLRKDLMLIEEKKKAKAKEEATWIRI